MTTERNANILGYLGVLPFAAGAAAAWLPGLPAGILAACLGWLLAYGAIILSFMGGARWGIAMLAGGQERGSPMSGLLVAVSPALLAWAALVPEALSPVSLPIGLRFSMLIAGFVGLLSVDLRAVRAGEAPAWYGRLRTGLTGLVVLFLALTVLRLFLAG